METFHLAIAQSGNRGITDSFPLFIIIVIIISHYHFSCFIIHHSFFTRDVPQHIKYRIAPAAYPIAIDNLYDDTSLVSSSTLEGITLVKSLHLVSSDKDE